VSRFKVLVADYAWPSLAVEQAVLAQVGAELVVAQSGDEAELVALAQKHDVTAVMVNWKEVTPAVLTAAPNCQIVARFGVGVDNIAVETATERGIVVANVPDYCYEETSDHALALVMALGRNLIPLVNDTKRGNWDLHVSPRPFARLDTQTVGVVGYGRIGQALAEKARGIGMRVIAYTPRLTPDRVADGIEATQDLGYLLAQSDYVSLHLPAHAGTAKLMNAAMFEQMKPTAYLINTARGAVVDEDALYDALQSGQIAGAALDVISTEYAQSGNKLLGLDNVWITPHAAFYSPTAIADLSQKTAENVAAVLRGGRPPAPYVVNPAVYD